MIRVLTRCRDNFLKLSNDAKEDGNYALMKSWKHEGEIVNKSIATPPQSEAQEITGENFWHKDLAEVEGSFLGGKKVTDLPIMNTVNGIPDKEQDKS